MQSRMTHTSPTGIVARGLAVLSYTPHGNPKIGYLGQPQKFITTIIPLCPDLCLGRDVKRM